MTEPLPAPVARAVDAVNAGDTDDRFAFEVEGAALRSMTITA
jgi:hypothetical protein